MSVEPDQSMRRPDGQAMYSPNSPPTSIPQADESPELLRWRAEQLMDEMMLGAVDTSAADMGAANVGEASAVDVDWMGKAPANGSSTYSDVPYSNGGVSTLIPPSPSANTFSPPSGLSSSNLSSSVLSSPSPTMSSPSSDRWGYEEPKGDQGANGNGMYKADSSQPAVDAGATRASDVADPRVNPAPSPATGHPTPNSDKAQLYAIEQRYEAYIRRQQAASDPPSMEPTTAVPETSRWQYQDFSAPRVPPEAAAAAPGSIYGAPGGVEVSVGAMAVTVNGKKRSTLLPRMSEVSAEELNREIVALHGELAVLAPTGHEAGDRARHLLEKAYTILQSDPNRSAEVEYYMQQVRAIVTRIRQAQSWSNLYRDRLRVYLGAWSMLSLILLATRYVFQPHLESVLLVFAAPAADGVPMRHFAALVGAMFAGALGGAVGALFTMNQQAQPTGGFYDRKYGLRGLMLPLIGLTFGALLYLLCGIIFHLADINPSVDWVTATLPVLGALIFGLSQESIYGTRR
jgi:hypothetical protein